MLALPSECIQSPAISHLYATTLSHLHYCRMHLTDLPAAAPVSLFLSLTYIHRCHTYTWCRKLHKQSLISFYKVNIIVIFTIFVCVCICVYFNASLIHEYDLVFCGSLVIVIHLLLSPVMAKLLSDFQSHQESL